jgi:hypothetical protein
VTTVTGLAAGLILAAVARPVSAQGVEAFYLVSRAAHPELPDPHGRGVALRFTLTDRLSIRWALLNYRAHVVRDRKVCIFHTPDFDCARESTVSDASLLGVNVTGMLRLLGEETAELGAGVGISVNQLHHRVEVATSRRSPGIVEPHAGQAGALLRLEGRIAPENLPVYVAAGLRAHWVRFTGCLQGASETITPFCNWTAIRDLQLSVGVRF